MRSQCFILFPGPSRWRIAVANARGVRWIEAPLAADAGADEIATVISDTVSRAGHRGNAVLLALPSRWCMAATVQSEQSPRRDRKAMLFAVEEKLPLAAEDVVADFIHAPDRTIGICARLQIVRPIVDALEARGVAVESISPAALLAAQAKTRTDEVHLLLLAEEDLVNVITIKDTLPVAWSLAPANEQDLKLHLEMAQLQHGAIEVHSLGLDAALASLSNSHNSLETMYDAARRGGEAALRGTSRPWIELRRDALAPQDRFRAHRRALNSLLAVAAALFLALAAATLVRAHRYESRVVQHEQQLAELFRAEFPGWNLPANIPALIDSEHSRLGAQQAGAAQQASAESALRTLVRVLGSMPSDIRVASDRLTFDDRGFLIDGRTANLSDLDAITSAIRSAGLRVSPPLTQRDADGTTWKFSLRGELGGATPASPRLAEIKPW